MHVCFKKTSGKSHYTHVLSRGRVICNGSFVIVRRVVTKVSSWAVLVRQVLSLFSQAVVQIKAQCTMDGIREIQALLMFHFWRLSISNQLSFFLSILFSILTNRKPKDA